MTGTIQNRESFLATLKEKLPDIPYEPYKAPTDLLQRHLKDKSMDELLAMAKVQADAVSANMLVITSAELNDVIADLINKAGNGQVMIPDDPQFDEFHISVKSDKVVKWQKGADKREENVIAAQNSNVAVAFAKFFLAESATIAVESSAGQGRSLHFLPTHYISIIPQSRVVAHMTEATDWFDANKVDGSSINFISGPSNSGDIEMQLVIGLHGPLEINYLIVKDL